MDKAVVDKKTELSYDVNNVYPVIIKYCRKNNLHDYFVYNDLLRFFRRYHKFTQENKNISMDFILTQSLQNEFEDNSIISYHSHIPKRLDYRYLRGEEREMYIFNLAENNLDSLMKGLNPKEFDHVAKLVLTPTQLSQ